MELSGDKKFVSFFWLDIASSEPEPRSWMCPLKASADTRYWYTAYSKWHQFLKHSTPLLRVLWAVCCYNHIGQRKSQYCCLVFMYHISILVHCLAFGFYDSFKTLFIWLVLLRPILFLQKDFLSAHIVRTCDFSVGHVYPTWLTWLTYMASNLVTCFCAWPTSQP